MTKEIWQDDLRDVRARIIHPNCLERRLLILREGSEPVTIGRLRRRLLESAGDTTKRDARKLKHGEVWIK